MTDDMRLAQLLDDQFTEQGSARNPFAPFAAGTDLNHLSLRGNFNLIEVAEAVHAAGWRPPAQVIDNYHDLIHLPERAIVIDADSVVFEHSGAPSADRWYGLGLQDKFFEAQEVIELPATVLWSPTEKAGE